MRRVGLATCGLILCAVLASSPVLLLPFDEVANRAIDAELPAEIEELSDPKVDERNEDKAQSGAGLDRRTPHGAALFLRLSLAQVWRSDYPRGSLSLGLRAPPA